MKLDPILYHTEKISINCIKDFHVRSKTIKLLDENRGDKLLNTDLGNNFLDLTAKAKATRAKVKKWD